MSAYHRINTLALGYDAGEHNAYRVARYTALKHTMNLQVFPLVQDFLRAGEIYTRSKDKFASNDFSMTRWLTPFMAGYQGIALFADCDMLFTRSLNNMFKSIPNFEEKACYVVKHNYTPKTTNKMDGLPQYTYPMKNWSSLVLWNCEHPEVRKLTPELINHAAPADLHQFRWLDHNLIGDLPLSFNFLVGEYPAPDEDAKTLTEATDNTPTVLHYTLGVPSIHTNLFTTDYTNLFKVTYKEFEESK